MPRIMEAEIQQDAQTIERKDGEKLDPFAPDAKDLIPLTEENAAYIIREISKGRSLIRITEEEGLPHFTTFLRHCQTNPELGEAYQAAKKVRAHARVEEVEGIVGELDPKDADKQTVYAIDVKAKNLIRLAEVGDPATFSPRMQHTHTGNMVNITLDLSSPQPNPRQIIDAEPQQPTETPQIDKPHSGQRVEKDEGGGGS